MQKLQVKHIQFFEADIERLSKLTSLNRYNFEQAVVKSHPVPPLVNASSAYFVTHKPYHSTLWVNVRDLSSVSWMTNAVLHQSRKQHYSMVKHLHKCKDLNIPHGTCFKLRRQPIIIQNEKFVSFGGDEQQVLRFALQRARYSAKAMIP